MAGTRMDPRLIKPELEEEFVCYCGRVKEAEIMNAIQRNGLKSVDEVRLATRAGCGCQTCWPELEEILERCGVNLCNKLFRKDDNSSQE